MRIIEELSSGFHLSPSPCLSPTPLAFSQLFDLWPHDGVEEICGACGRIVVFSAGLSQERRYRLPSHTLIVDLQYRLRCAHCNVRQGFRIAVVDTTCQGPMGTPRSRRIVVERQ